MIGERPARMPCNSTTNASDVVGLSHGPTTPIEQSYPRAGWMHRVRVHDQEPVPNKPRFGCYWATAYPRGDEHRLSWAGWWQSANPEVAWLRWRCICGQWTDDHNEARWYHGERLGGLFRADRH